MSSFPNSPALLKAGLVLLDPHSGAVQRVINLQYNPETLTRSLQPQTTASEGADRSDAMRLKGPPVETFKLDAEIDATDQLETPEQNQNAVQFGIQPQLAALETILYPTSSSLQSNNTMSQLGTLEILPVLAPLTLFVWSKNRVVPVRLTDFSITEEAFDAALNPIRAKVSIGMRALSINDIGFDTKAATIYLSYQQQKEQLAGKSAPGSLGVLGLGGIP